MNAEIKKHCLQILEPELHYGKVREACNELYAIFSRLSGFEHDAISLHADEHTLSGTAIGPYNAAFCLVDFWRTRQFIRGIEEAIIDRLQKKSGPLIILYAGTGPFASLLVPLCTKYSADQIKLVLLEYNPVSYEHMRRIFKVLDLEEYILYARCTDAGKWRITETFQPDIVVCETMNKALEKEPQVELVSSLLSQCSKDPILIPETINVSAALKNENGDDFSVVKTLLQLDKESAIKINNNGMEAVMNDSTIEIPLAGDHHSELWLLTEINVYKDHWLHSGECSITLPFKIKSPNTTGFPIRLIYKMGEKPGFRIASH